MIIFNHIPKSGGTLIFSKLKSIYKYVNFRKGKATSEFEKILNTYFPGNNESRIAETNCTSISDIQLVRAHTKFTNFKKFNDNDFYFTILRNPVDLFYSEFLHGKRQKSIPELLSKLDEKIKKYNGVFRLRSFMNLEKYDFVGIQEEMGLTIKKLENILSIDLSKPPHVSNENPQKKKNILYNHKRKKLEDAYIKSKAFEEYNKYLEILKK